MNGNWMKRNDRKNEKKNNKKQTKYERNVTETI